MRCLIHAAKAHAGGGITVAMQLIRALSSNSNSLGYEYVLIASEELAERLSDTTAMAAIEVVPIERSSGLYALHYYYMQIPYFLHKYEIDVVFNLGDIILPRARCPQIYFFDYPLIAGSVYHAGFRGREWVKQTVKKSLISLSIASNHSIICQSELIQSQLQSGYPEIPARVLPMPLQDWPYVDQDRDPTKFAYVASPSEHKNHAILLDVAFELRRRRLPYTITVTLLPNDNSLTSSLYRRLEAEDLAQYVVPVGRLEHNDVMYLLSSCIGTVMPSTAETYGLPYFESMQTRTPLAVSDLPFARSACREAAIYFDPMDGRGIVDSMHRIATEPNLRAHLSNEGAKIVANMTNTAAYCRRLEDIFDRAVSPTGLA